LLTLQGSPDPTNLREARLVPNSFAEARTPRAQHREPSVAILLGTKDGAAFLDEQLRSLADQTHRNWILIVSDDGSTDTTRDVLERFAASVPQKVVIREGPRRGPCANFLSLAIDRSIEADYFAYSDQDDVWYPDKLERALDWLVTAAQDMPALYCGRTEIVLVDGRPTGLSTCFSRPAGFRNALIQNIAAGNTMVFNRAAKNLLETAVEHQVVVHDWWTYQLISGAGGRVHYDPRPVLKYRQHRDNLIGSNLGWQAHLTRVTLMLNGTFANWNATNIAALQSLPKHLIRPENREIIEHLARAQSSSLLDRLRHVWQSGVYRQTWLGNLGLWLATFLKKI
jgi:hypothetical protein